MESTCNQRKLCDRESCELCFKRSFANSDKAQFWDADLNKGVVPRQVFLSSHKIFWFHCTCCNHVFDSSLSNVTNGQWCPYCSSHKLCKNQNCNQCFEKSFASHEKSKYWNYDKNKILSRDLFLNSHKKYWFTCGNCYHDFDSTLNQITNGKWCPFCANQKLCYNQTCKQCFAKSFASHEKSKYWNYDKNKILSRDLFLNSHKKYWFTCENCYHDFDSTLNSITCGSWCPYCSNKKLCENDTCITCLEKSFSIHEKSKYWNYDKNKILSRDLFLNSHKKYWFTCEKGHEFDMRLSHIALENNWCRFCMNKSEQKLQDRLKMDFPSLQREISPSWAKRKRYDFLIPELNVIIELDGPQHFMQISSWPSPESQHDNDVEKIMRAIDNGYSVIRIVQEDVLNDKYDWYSELYDNIIDSKASVSFMCKHNEYDLLSVTIDAIIAPKKTPLNNERLVSGYT